MIKSFWMWMGGSLLLGYGLSIVGGMEWLFMTPAIALMLAGFISAVYRVAKQEMKKQ